MYFENQFTTAIISNTGFFWKKRQMPVFRGKMSMDVAPKVTKLFIRENTEIKYHFIRSKKKDALKKRSDEWMFIPYTL